MTGGIRDETGYPTTGQGTAREKDTVIFYFDHFEFDPERLELTRAGTPVKADRMALRLLEPLVKAGGQLVTKHELIALAWEGRAVAENALTVAMVRLRKVLGKGEFVRNERGRGYRFVPPVTSSGSPKPERSTISADAAPSTPFVGRERVIERLHAALRAASAGRGSALLLMGEPGIGKTRAVEELERSAGHGQAFFAWGYCREAGDTPPLWPIAQLVREANASLQDTTSKASLGPAYADLRNLLPELDKPDPLRSDEGSATPQIKGPGRVVPKHRMFDAIVRVFSVLAERVACVLVLDDLHRADAASLELLRYLIDELARRPILLLCTTRTSEGAASPAAQAHLDYVLGHRNCTRVELERLSEAQVVAYLGELGNDPDGVLGRSVFEKSEGNPFFMVELGRQLERLPFADPASLQTSSAALDLVRQRMSTLDEETRGVLSCAAVIGREFELGVLHKAMRDDPHGLMASLDLAVASDVVAAVPNSRTAFAFRHELLRAALYDALPPAERRRLHLRIGETLEAMAPSSDRVPPSDLARHFYAALPDGDLRKCIRCCRHAAAAASVVHGFADAVRQLGFAQEALALMDDPSPRLRVNLLLSQAVFARFLSSDEFESVVRQTITAAREHGLGDQLARGALLLDPHPGLPPVTGARAALEEAQRALAPGEDALAAAVLARLATTPPLAYDRQRSLEQVARASALGRDTGSVLALYTIALAKLYLTGGMPERTVAPAVDELERLCREHPTVLSVPPLMLGLHRSITALKHGDQQGARIALTRCQTRARELGHGELIWHLERALVMLRVNSGQVDPCMPQLATLARRARGGAIIAAEVFCAYDRYVVMVDFGDAPPPGVDPPAPAGGPADPPNLWSMRVRALAAAGFSDEARIALQEVAPAALSRLPFDRDYLGTLGHLVHAVLALRAQDYAQALYELLGPDKQPAEAFAIDASFFCEGSVAQLRGMLALALGHREEAVAQLQQGVKFAELAGFSLCATAARRALAGC